MAAAILEIFAVLWMFLVSSTALAGIAGTRHDLSASGYGSEELCAFCHTPHFAKNIDGPLWNRIGSSNTFTGYGNTIGGSAVAGTDITSYTKSCLTCHDGVSALNSLGNYPGRGGLSSTAVTGGNNISTTSAVIGTDLSNDHPVSITYDTSGKNGRLRALSFALSNWSGASSVTGLLRNGKVECGSCHDPHGGIANTLFLRVANAGSALCFGCHNM